MPEQPGPDPLLLLRRAVRACTCGRRRQGDRRRAARLPAQSRLALPQGRRRLPAGRPPGAPAPPADPARRQGRHRWSGPPGTRRSTTSSAAGRRSRREHGKDAVAVYSGSSMTNEKCYLTGKFARVGLGTRHIDYNGRLCMSSAAMAYARAFGIDRAPLPMTDIPLADCILVVGSNVAECFPIMMQWIWQARDRGASLIVVDPRETPIARTADLWLPVRPGTDVAAAERDAPPGDPRRAGRRGVPGRAHDRLGRGPRRPSRRTRRRWPSASPACRPSASWRRRACTAGRRPR